MNLRATIQRLKPNEKFPRCEYLASEADLFNPRWRWTVWRNEAAVMPLEAAEKLAKDVGGWPVLTKA